MKPLATLFRSDGFEFRQLERVGRVAVFEKRKGEPNISYEVVRIRQVPETTMFGRTVPAHEALPCNEQWGLYGWTYHDKTAAFRKFRELAQECPRLSTPMPKHTPIATEACERAACRRQTEVSCRESIAVNTDTGKVS